MFSSLNIRLKYVLVQRTITRYIHHKSSQTPRYFLFSENNHPPRAGYLAQVLKRPDSETTTIACKQ